MLIITYKLHYWLKSPCLFFQSPFICSGNKGKLNYLYADSKKKKKSHSNFPTYTGAYNLCTDFRLLEHPWCRVESYLSFSVLQNFDRLGKFLYVGLTPHRITSHSRQTPISEIHWVEPTYAWRHISETLNYIKGKIKKTGT